MKSPRSIRYCVEMLRRANNKLIFETDTPHGHYQVWDMIYDGRPARVLYSGQRRAAQSGVAKDDNSDLLFDYNQRFLELARGLQPTRVLLIGGGVYTLPSALLVALPAALIDVVEIDSGLDAVAEQFFDFQPRNRLKIIHEDGWQFLQHSAARYDLILLDAFIDTAAPGSLRTVAAIEQFKRSLAPAGVLASNIIAPYYGPAAKPLRHQLQNYRSVFDHVELYPASHSLPLGIAQNFLLVAQTGKPHSVVDYLRYPPLENSGEV